MTTLSEMGITYISGSGSVREVREQLGLHTHQKGDEKARGGSWKSPLSTPAFSTPTRLGGDERKELSPVPPKSCILPNARHPFFNDETYKTYNWALLRIEYVGG